MKRDISDRTSWIVAITSIAYGITVIARSIMYHETLMESSTNYIVLLAQNYISSFLLIVLAIMKIVFMIKNVPIMRKISIVGLMFTWCFIEADYVFNFIMEEPNREAILIAPIIMLCIFIASRSDST